MRVSVFQFLILAVVSNRVSCKVFQFLILAVVILVVNNRPWPGLLRPLLLLLVANLHLLMLAPLPWPHFEKRSKVSHESVGMTAKLTAMMQNCVNKAGSASLSSVWSHLLYCKLLFEILVEH